jgi:hypothetical protein
MKSPRYTTFLLVMTAVLFLGACVSTQATMLSGSARPAITEDQVKIYRTADQIPGRYEEVALLTSAGDYSMTNEAEMFASMRKKAAALGANGVLLQQVVEPTTGAKVANAFLGTSANRKGQSVAIYVFVEEQ